MLTARRGSYSLDQTKLEGEGVSKEPHCWDYVGLGPDQHRVLIAVNMLFPASVLPIPEGLWLHLGEAQECSPLGRLTRRLTKVKLPIANIIVAQSPVVRPILVMVWVGSSFDRAGRISA